MASLEKSKSAVLQVGTCIGATVATIVVPGAVSAFVGGAIVSRIALQVAERTGFCDWLARNGPNDLTMTAMTIGVGVLASGGIRYAFDTEFRRKVQNLLTHEGLRLVMQNAKSVLRRGWSWLKGKAIPSALNQWDRLMRFLYDALFTGSDKFEGNQAMQDYLIDTCLMPLAA